MAKKDPRLYYIYILKITTKKGKSLYYTGMTIDLEARVRQHKNGKARYTKGKQPKLLYFEKMFGTWKEARKREKQLKKLSRKQKQALINKKKEGELIVK